jgi:hypothetical protein
MALKYNQDPSFAGITKLIEAHSAQIAEFEAWAATGDWEKFHSRHYDWWVFPVDQPSSYGYRWTVYGGEVAELKKDAGFVEKYLLGVRLVAASWGWDIYGRACLPAPAAGQSWHHWPVRLFKAAQSVRLFSYLDEFESLKLFALELMKNGEQMTYNRWDLSWIFTSGIDPYQRS